MSRRYFRVPVEAFELAGSGNEYLAIARLYYMMNKYRDGKLSFTRRDLAGQLEVSKGCLDRVLRYLSASGLIVIDSSRLGSAVTPVWSAHAEGPEPRVADEHADNSSEVNGSESSPEPPPEPEQANAGGEAPRAIPEPILSHRCSGSTNEVSGQNSNPEPILSHPTTTRTYTRTYTRRQQSSDWFTHPEPEPAKPERQPHPRLMAAVDAWNAAANRKNSTLSRIRGGNPFGSGVLGHLQKTLAKLDSDADGLALGGAQGLFDWFAYLECGPWQEVGWWHSGTAKTAKNASAWGKLVLEYIPKSQADAARRASARPPTDWEALDARQEAELAAQPMPDVEAPY